VPTHVRYAPKTTELLHRRKMTRCAINDQVHRNNMGGA